jgi:hypothetical protein
MLINIHVMPDDELVNKAIEAYNRHKNKNGRANRLPEGTLHRIVVNYIRHTLTDYEQLVAAANNRFDVRDVQDAVFNAIAAAYPKYARECMMRLHLSEPFYSRN